MTIEEKIKNYKCSSQTVELIKSTPIILIVGPTGAGKDTLKDMLLASGNYHHIVSHTTRPPRINKGIKETDGLEYHFIDRQEAERMIDNYEFIEVKYYSGNIYGTSVSEIEIAHKDSKVALTDIEVQGVAEYKGIDKNVMAIFLVPPDFEEWQKRLSSRYGDVVDAEDHEQRLRAALDEINQLLNTDYYTAVVNSERHITFNLIQQIVESKNINIDDSEARASAKKLAQDIQNYLAG
jgi:guanylate kinase